MTRRLEVRWMPAADANDAALSHLAATFAEVHGDAVRVVRACRSCGSDQHGKPQIIRLDGGAPIYVSLSRSGDVAVLAVTGAGPVGVDLELAATPKIRTWVRVESLIKATGHGLQIDPDSISVTAPDLEPALLAWPLDEPIDLPAWMFDLGAPNGLTACATVLSAERPRLVPTEAAQGV